MLSRRRKRTLIGLYLSCCDVDEKSWFDPKSLMLPVLLPPPALEIASNSFCCCCKRFCLCCRSTAMAAIILNCTQDWKNEKKFLMNNKRSHFRFPGVVSEIQPKSSVMKKVFFRSFGVEYQRDFLAFRILSGQMESHKNAYTELITI